jgi:hypothetical protein
MNQILQFLAGNAWLLIPIIIGLFNVAVRVKQKAAEQKAKRDALAEIQRRKTESLRTGRQVNEPIIVYDQPEKKSVKTPAQERQERIEALRKQRMDQLRAMREKRAGGASAPQRSSQSQQSRSILAQRASTPQQPVRRPTPAQTRPSPVNRPRVIPASQPQRPKTQSPSLIAPMQLPPTRVEPASTAPVSAIAASTLHDLRKDRPNKGGLKALGSSGLAKSTRDMLHDRKQVRQATVLREVLNAPVALRDPDLGPGNLRS